MEKVGKFIILESNLRSDPIDSFVKRTEFDEIFHRTYNHIEDAFLWMDTILYYSGPLSLHNSTRKQWLSCKNDKPPVNVKIDEMDRLASFPTNLRFVAKKMALYFYKNGISLSSIKNEPGFNPIIEVVIIAVLHYFLIQTEYDDIFERISKPGSMEFALFFKLIDEFNLPYSMPPEKQSGFNKYKDREPYYKSIIKAARQLSTIIGFSGFLNTDSSQLDQMPPEQRQELINLLQDTSRNVIIYVKIEDEPIKPVATIEPGKPDAPKLGPSKEEVMSLIGSLDESLPVKNAKAVERIRSKIASRRSQRMGGKHRNTHRRKKNEKHSKKSRRR